MARNSAGRTGTRKTPGSGRKPAGGKNARPHSGTRPRTQSASRTGSGSGSRAVSRSVSRPVSRWVPRLVLTGGVMVTLAAAAFVVLALSFTPEPDLEREPGATARIEALVPARPATRVAEDPAAPQVAAAPPRPAVAPRAWERHAVPVSVAAGQPMIAVVIDDMGVDRARSERTVALPGPLTLAYLGYARELDAQSAAARTAGHELLVHVPMEPQGAAADPGPNALLTGLAPDELTRRIDWNLSRFDRFVGINNHMGSKATADRDVMDAVMAALDARGLLFLDSRTSSETVAQAAASRRGIPALRRDVFIDHDPSPIAVRAALLQAEEVAERQGFAIAIGHPKDATIDALAEWLPDVQARGFAVVPVSAVARRLAGG
jgi:polysaccharide deacetylase 2 family uncharacterized protein YibQ